MNDKLTNIIKDAQEGKEKALISLFTMYSKNMFNVCIRLTGNQNDAEDILQDCFMIAFTKIKSLKNPDHFGGWLKKIVIRESLRFCKTRMLFEEIEEHQDSSYLDDDIHWWLDISLQDIHNAIKTLPEGCRIVFVLYALEDYSHKEVAHALEISEGTSKSQYYRARTILQEKIVKKAQANGRF